MIFNTVQTLLDYCKLQLSQEVSFIDAEYNIWSDSELIEYIDYAQQEFSKFCLCIPDYDTYSIPIIAGTNHYTLDHNIIQVVGGKLLSSNQRVKADNFKNIERRFILNDDVIVNDGDWELEQGRVKFIITDLDYNQLITYPIPTSNDTLNLYVFRVSNTITQVSDALEIPQHHRAGLVFRVMSLALNKRDSTEWNTQDLSLMYSQKWQSFLNDAKEFYDKKFFRLETTNGSRG